MNRFIRIINDFHHPDKIKSIIPDFDAKKVTIYFDDGSSQDYDNQENHVFNKLVKLHETE